MGYFVTGLVLNFCVLHITFLYFWYFKIDLHKYIYICIYIVFIIVIASFYYHYFPIRKKVQLIKYIYIYIYIYIYNFSYIKRIIFTIAIFLFGRKISTQEKYNENVLCLIRFLSRPNTKD